MFLCYDIIQDVPRLRSLSRSLAILPNLSSSKPAERTIRGLERTHLQGMWMTEMMWMDIIVEQIESVSGSSLSLRRYTKRGLIRA